MGFAKFMSSGLGRGLRIVVGLALIVIGLFSVGGAGGSILAVVGGPLKGADARAKAA